MAASEHGAQKTLVAALARNRGELDPARLGALLERAGAPPPPKRTHAA